MKTLTIRIYDDGGREVAWVRMSSKRQLEAVSPETGGPMAPALDLPTGPADLVTLGCEVAAAAQSAGLDYRREWEGQWDLEPSTPEDRNQ